MAAMGSGVQQTQRGERRWWVLALVVGVALSAVFMLVPADSVAAAILITAAAVLLVFANYVGVRTNRQAFSVRQLTTATWATQAVAVGWYALYPHLTGRVLPFPSGADAVFLLADAFLIAALVAINRHGGVRDRGATIDALIVTLAIGTISWAFVIEPLLGLEGESLAKRVAPIGYALVDLAVVGLLLRTFFLHGRGQVAQGVLAAGISLLVVSNETYAASLLVASLTELRVYDLLFMLSWTLIAAGALHPSLRNLVNPGGARQHALSGGRLAFLGAMVVLPLAVIVLEILVVGRLDVPARLGLYSVGTVMSLLVLARMRGLLVDISRNREMQRLKNQFTSVVSHELRTPLTSIRGSLGLMAGGALGEMPPQAQRMLGIAVTNTDRLIRLINDILDLERVEAGEVAMEMRRVAAGDVVREAVRELEGMGRTAGVTLQAEADGVIVCGDRDRLIQTLTNLIGNAIKFSERDGLVRVTVESSGETATFRVEDQGRGIPPEKLDTIFQAFEQVDASDSREKGGTGLGLAISRMIVARHRGQIWAESVPGQGSTFAFTIPAVAAELSDREAHGPTVLLCDDDESVREVLGAMLSERGYRVVSASTGDEAVRRAVEDQPDAILLDILMPGFDGWETLAALRQRDETSAIPVVIMSVLPEEPGRPVEGWVEKPIDEPSLFCALEVALRGKTGDRCVLLVEDDADLASVLVERLGALGLSTLHASTVAEAVRLAGETEPDLLVLDLGLPDGHGGEVVEALRADPTLRHIPVVVFTARDVPAAERERLGLGETAYLSKGRITLEEFETSVLDLLASVAPAGADSASPRLGART
jgi:signal transduction histidine kinase/DNA-binding response OmpR family regulator